MLSEQEERLSARITDNRREMTEAARRQNRKEWESLAWTRYPRNIIRIPQMSHAYQAYRGRNSSGCTSVSEYYDYILKNFRNPKPKEEWTDADYKADYSRWQRLHVASVLRQQLMKQTIPLIDRQKRIIERVRNGTDFDVFSSQKFLEMLS